MMRTPHHSNMNDKKECNIHTRMKHINQDHDNHTADNHIHAHRNQKATTTINTQPYQ